MLFLIAVWQLFRVFGGSITDAENPWTLVARSTLFAAVEGDTVMHNGKEAEVPNDSFYVLDDNQKVPLDSRSWAYPFVKAETVIAVYLS